MGNPIRMQPLQPQEDLLSKFGRVSQLRNVLQSGEANRLELDERKRSMQTRLAISEAISKAGGDVKAALPEIMKISPEMGMEYQKAVNDWDASDDKAKEAKTRRAVAQLETLSSMLGSVNDQAGYQAAIQEAVSNGLVDERTAQYYAGLPFSPQLKERLGKMVLNQLDLAKLANEEIRTGLLRAQTRGAEADATISEQEASLTAAERANLKQPRQVPGQDVPYSPDVEAQRKRMNPPGSSGSNIMNRDDAKEIAQDIINGLQPPTLNGLYRNAGPVRAELARQDFPLARAESDWKAIQKHLSTLNGAQQERLRQAITFTADSLDVIDGLYAEWKATGLQSGVKIFNKAALAAAKQLPGNAGATANTLQAQINDLTAELGTVYKGGNSSTDESLRLAAENLKADWNEETFNKAMKTIRTNLRIRKNSIMTSEAVGVSANSPYKPPQAGEQAPPAGLTNIMVNPQTGEKIGWDGKAWVPAP